MTQSLCPPLIDQAAQRVALTGALDQLERRALPRCARIVIAWHFVGSQVVVRASVLRRRAPTVTAVEAAQVR